ncbi:Exopolyphosphatase [Salix suchowensis]|nr:Exopolyphosphatase [Salix suchowensis]
MHKTVTTAACIYTSLLPYLKHVIGLSRFTSFRLLEHYITCGSSRNLKVSLHAQPCLLKFADVLFASTSPQTSLSLSLLHHVQKSAEATVDGPQVQHERECCCIVVKSAPTIPETHTLSEFLTSAKTNYLRDIKDASVGGGEWTVSMGTRLEVSEPTAGPGPSLTLGKFQQTLTVSRVLSRITNPLESLVSITDIGNDAPFPSHKFALVDHNHLGERFIQKTRPPRSSQSLTTTKTRVFTRALRSRGSSEKRVVALRIADNVPAELATLLLCAILIDTGGLKANGKALPVDYEAATALIPMSTYASDVDPTSYSGDKLADAPAIKTLTAALSSKKEDVSRLSAYDLLRRDYKEYSHPLQWLPTRWPRGCGGLKASDDLKLKKHKKFELVPKKERKEKEKGSDGRRLPGGNKGGGGPGGTAAGDRRCRRDGGEASQTEVRASQQTDSAAYGGLAEESRKSE